MRSICLPGTDLNVSRFVFGTASLHHLGREAAQAAHLEAAAAAGFTHFDTAPLYGFGGAECALGTVFSGDMQITVATKVGLYPPGGEGKGRNAMIAQKLAGKIWPALSRAVADFGVERARQSLEYSLKRLRRQHVDLLLLHEPDASLLHTEEWKRWLESETDRVRNVGVAGPAATVSPFILTGSPLAHVIQVCDGLETREADIVTRAGRPFQLTYGYFSSETGGRSSAEVLTGALARNTNGAVLVSTRSRKRLLEFAEAAAQENSC